jgi:hypothetical protein
LETEIFDSITLVRNFILAASIAIIEFDVIAPKLMPYPRARLLEHGLVKRHNLPQFSYLPKGGVKQTVSFFGASIRMCLNFRNPPTS